MNFSAVRTCVFYILLCSLAYADEIESYPGWNLSQEADDHGNERFFLDPPDGRPTIAVTADAAKRLQAGTINPEHLYKDKNGTGSQGKNSNGVESSGSDISGTPGSAKSSGGSSGSSSHSKAGSSAPQSNYIRFNPPAAVSSEPAARPTLVPSSGGISAGDKDVTPEKKSKEETNPEGAAIKTTQTKLSDVNQVVATPKAPLKGGSFSASQYQYGGCAGAGYDFTITRIGSGIGYKYTFSLKARGDYQSWVTKADKKELSEGTVEFLHNYRRDTVNVKVTIPADPKTAPTVEISDCKGRYGGPRGAITYNPKDEEFK